MRKKVTFQEPETPQVAVGSCWDRGSPRKNPLSDRDLSAIVMKTLCSGGAEVEVYRRNPAGNPHQVTFTAKVYADGLDRIRNSEITRLNEPELMMNLLRMAQNCRVIGREVYDIVEHLEMDGMYVVAVSERPVLRVEGPRESLWLARPVTIESYDGKNRFLHIPDNQRNIFDLELSIEGRETRKPIEEIFRGAYKFYKSAGFALVEGKE